MNDYELSPLAGHGWRGPAAAHVKDESPALGRYKPDTYDSVAALLARISNITCSLHACGRSERTAVILTETFERLAAELRS